MNFQKIMRIVTTALFIAIICVATIVVQIPSPLTGYFNLGDCFVLIAAWFLGPCYGSIAAGIGSALADIILGYTMYAPGTFVIKALMAATAFMVYKAIKKPFIGKAVSAFTAEAVMVLGYFVYESVILKYGLAAASAIPTNIAQGVVAIVAAVALASAMKKSKALNSFLKGSK